MLSAWQRIPPNPNRLSLVDLDFPLHDLVDIDFFMSRLDDFAIFFHVATLKKSIPNLIIVSDTSRNQTLVGYAIIAFLAFSP